MSARLSSLHQECASDHAFSELALGIASTGVVHPVPGKQGARKRPETPPQRQRRPKQTIKDGGTVLKATGLSHRIKPTSLFLQLAMYAFIFFICYFALQFHGNTAGDNHPPTGILFIGNPGSGKSSLLNAHAGRVMFKSGVTLNGIGWAGTFDSKKIGRILYIDTPGLDNFENREAASSEISSSLKTGIGCKIFFVVTLQAGRVQPADVTMMKMVLDAAPIKQYGIIVNKVESQLKHRFAENGLKLDELRAKLVMHLPRPTEHVHLIGFLGALFDEDDAIWESDAAFKQFINRVPLSHIAAKDVRNITTKTFDAQTDEMSKQLRLSEKTEAL